MWPPSYAVVSSSTSTSTTLSSLRCSSTQSASTKDFLPAHDVSLLRWEIGLWVPRPSRRRRDRGRGGEAGARTRASGPTQRGTHPAVIHGPAANERQAPMRSSSSRRQPRGAGTRRSPKRCRLKSNETYGPDMTIARAPGERRQDLDPTGSVRTRSRSSAGPPRRRSAANKRLNTRSEPGIFRAACACRRASATDRRLYRFWLDPGGRSGARPVMKGNHHHWSTLGQYFLPRSRSGRAERYRGTESLGKETEWPLCCC